MTEQRRNADNKFFWSIMSFALVFPSLATWLYFMVLSGSPVMAPVYSATKIFQFSLPVVAVWWLWKQRISMFSGGWHSIAPGVIFGLLTAVSIVGLYLVYLRHSPVFAMFDAALTEKLEGLGASTPLRYAILAVFISIFHSFLEEYYWRWFVFGQLIRRVPGWIAYMVASLGFAAHHVLVVLAYFGTENLPWVVFFSLGVAIGGAIWCWLYQRSNSLYSPWISHVLVDIALLAVGALHLWG